MQPSTNKVPGTVFTPLTHDQTLDCVLRGIEKKGDLPIFSASVNRIHMMSASQETELMELANEVLKDANLTTKLLRVANSPYYNRAATKVGVVSRAIIVLGYQTVRSIVLAMKVIESFRHEHQSVDLATTLVKSYMSAGFVKEMGIQCGVKDPEESYVCALLHNFGEIVVAATMAERYAAMTELAQKGDMAWREVQMSVLGTSFKRLAQAVLQKWDFPSGIVKTVDHYSKKANGPVRDKVQLNRAMASLSMDVMDCLYTPQVNPSLNYDDLLIELSHATGLKRDDVAGSLTKSFKMSCDLAEQFGLDKHKLKPVVLNEEDNARNRLARTLSFHTTRGAGDSAAKQNTEASTEEHEGEDAAAGAKSEASNAAPAGDAAALVSLFHEIALLVTNQADLNTVLSKVLEGLHHGAGFDTSLLCFLSPDRRQYKARFGVGRNVEALKAYFSFDVDTKKDLFSRLMLEQEEIFIKDVQDAKWKPFLRSDFTAKTKATSFVAAPLRYGDKPLGFFYADAALSGNTITPEMFRSFVQLVTQAKMALSVRYAGA